MNQQHVGLVICNPVQPKTTITGKENLEKAIAQKKGVLLLSFHMTSLEMGATLLCNYFEITPMYKPSKNPLTEYFMSTGRFTLCTSHSKSR